MSELTPERWKKIKDIYHQLADCPPDEWRRTLPQLCNGDQELQRDVEHYLQREIGGFLDGDSRRPQVSHTEILLRSGEALAGRYRVVKLLGTGGMADVYEVEDKELKKPVALKLIRSDLSFDDLLLERFRKEVELTRLVKHRNVCSVYDIGHDRREPRELTFLTMELIPGETMAERIRRSGPMAASEWLSVARQLCNAMQEAHSVNVLHRDFKPGNVMLVGSGENIRAVVTDFGIASAMGSQKVMPSALTAKYLMGTLLYMSPEQERGEALDATSDIYSLGLVLYEMLTGEQYRTSPQLEKISEDLGNWKRTIQRCLEADPKKRFNSANEVLHALEEPIADLPSHTVLIPPPPLPSKRNQLWVALAIAIASLLLVAATWGPSLSRSGMNLWKTLFVPLPKPEIVAIVPLRALSKDDRDQVLADATSESLIHELGDLQGSQGRLSVLPWDNVINLNHENAGLAATSLGFNLYVVAVVSQR